MVFSKGRNPIDGGSTLITESLLKGPSSYTITVGGGGEWVLGFRPLSQGGGCQFPSLPGLCL